MSVTQRSPTTRLIILAAFLLAVGLFAFRGYDTLTAMKSEPVGSALERELTYLLEPIAGPNKVRVSVTSRSPKTVLVMIDGDIGTDLRPLRTRIETILVASIGFKIEQDTLTLSQFPFARGIGGTLTVLQIAELTGLGLLGALLLIAGLTPGREMVQPRAVPERAPLQSESPRQARLAPPAAPTRAELTDATALAESKPNETAHVVRGWMSYAED